MTLIKLYGNLGKQFGKVHKLKVNSPAEAIRALCSLYPKFKEVIRDQYVRVRVDDKDIDIKDLHFPKCKTIKIIPVPAGAKGEWFGIVIGAALIGAAFWTGGASLAAWGSWQVGMALTGAGMLLNSAVAMLAPMPTMPDYSTRENPEEKPSYVYNGPTNTAEQGGPIPLVYGRFVVGSTVIAVDVDVEAL